MARQLRNQLEQETQFDPLADTSPGGCGGIEHDPRPGIDAERDTRSITRYLARYSPVSSADTSGDDSRAAPAQLADSTPPAHSSPAETSADEQSPGEGEPLAEGTLVSHLLELRDRLLRSVIAVVICFVPLAFFQNELFTLVARR